LRQPIEQLHCLALLGVQPRICPGQVISVLDRYKNTSQMSSRQQTESYRNGLSSIDSRVQFQNASLSL
jgi:hypothetical protein